MNFIRVMLPAWLKAKVPWILGGVTTALIGALLVMQRHISSDAAAVHRDRAPPEISRTGPPWIYGRVDARFTIVTYSDLECAYCRDYFPVLRRWIAEHPDVNWQWHHLPLSVDEPKATQAARIAECAGEIGGNSAFWKSVAWLYQHEIPDLAALASHAQLSNGPSALQACVVAARPSALIQRQVAEAAQAGIHATPTLRVLEHNAGRSLTLNGPQSGDTLLSAIDLLSSQQVPASAAPPPTIVIATRQR